MNLRAGYDLLLSYWTDSSISSVPPVWQRSILIDQLVSQKHCGLITCFVNPDNHCKQLINISFYWNSVFIHAETCSHASAITFAHVVPAHNKYVLNIYSKWKRAGLFFFNYKSNSHLLVKETLLRANSVIVVSMRYYVSSLLYLFYVSLHFKVIVIVFSFFIRIIFKEQRRHKHIFKGDINYNLKWIKSLLQNYVDRLIIYQDLNTFIKYLQDNLIQVYILFHKWFYIYAFSSSFYPKRLTVHSGCTCFFISMCVSWESNPQPLHC